MCSFVLVHLGPTVPPYLEACLNQIRRFNAAEPIYLLVDHDSEAMTAACAASATQLVQTSPFDADPAVKDFEARATVDRSWRGGFNFHAIKRFFYIECLLRTRGLEDVIHLEYDNTVYFEAALLGPVFRRHFPGLGLVLDNDARCIPGIVYVPHAKAIQTYVRWYLRHSLGKNENDMVALAEFRKGRFGMKQLPLISPQYTQGKRILFSADRSRARRPRAYSELFDEFGGVFDAAAFGQFLGGVDPRNQQGDTRGFVNEACIFSPAEYECSWRADTKNRRVPWASSRSTGESFRILNLHVHSKNLEPFLS